MVQLIKSWTKIYISLPSNLIKINVSPSCRHTQLQSSTRVAIWKLRERSPTITYFLLTLIKYYNSVFLWVPKKSQNSISDSTNTNIVRKAKLWYLQVRPHFARLLHRLQKLFACQPSRTTWEGARRATGIVSAAIERARGPPTSVSVMEMARCHGLGNGGRPPDEREATGKRRRWKIEGKV